MPSEHDQRKWMAVGEQTGAARAGQTMWSGPYLRPGERVVVVPEARALAAEQRGLVAERRAEKAERERDKAEEARGEAFKEATQRHDDLLRERKSAEQRVAELETQIGGAQGRMAELELEATELFAQRNGIDQQRESAEALLAKARRSLVWALKTIEAMGGPVREPWKLFDHARAVLAEITMAPKETRDG